MDGQADATACAIVDRQRAAMLLQAFAHAAQAIAFDPGGAAAPIVGDAQGDSVATAGQIDAESPRLRMAQRIGHAFLHAAEQGVGQRR